MNNFNTLFQVISLVFCVLCLACALWMASVLRDTTSYVMAGFLLVAVLWLSVELLRKLMERRKKK